MADMTTERSVTLSDTQVCEWIGDEALETEFRELLVGVGAYHDAFKRIALNDANAFASEHRLGMFFLDVDQERAQNEDELTWVVTFR